MKTPSLKDKIVKVRAFLTDQGFGYEHWQAKQFLTPEHARPALLIVFKTEDEREEYLNKQVKENESTSSQ